jgi:hypothetical protein
MGKPIDSTPAQVDQLSRETALPASQPLQMTGEKVKLEVSPDALMLLKLTLNGPASK